MTADDAAEDWPQYGHDAANTRSADRRWGAHHTPPRRERRISGALSAPVVVRGVAAFVDNENTLITSELSSGHVHWEQLLPRELDVEEGQPLLAVAGEVICACADDYVAGFRWDTGAMVWEQDGEGGGDVVPPAVVGTTAYVGDGMWVHAVAVSDGRSGWSWCVDPDEIISGISGVAVAAGTVYAACNDGLVFAIDARTGKERWPAVTGPELFQPVCVSGEFVVAASTDRVYGIDATTGERRWRRRLGAPIDVPLAVSGESVVACTRSSVVALAVEDGRVQWQTRFDGTLNAPTVAGEVVVIPSGSPDLLCAVSARDGSRLWEVPLDSRPTGPAVIAHERVLISDEAGIASFVFEA